MILAEDAGQGEGGSRPQRQGEGEWLNPSQFRENSGKEKFRELDGKYCELVYPLGVVDFHFSSSVLLFPCVVFIV